MLSGFDGISLLPAMMHSCLKKRSSPYSGIYQSMFIFGADDAIAIGMCFLESPVRNSSAPGESVRR